MRRFIRKTPRNKAFVRGRSVFSGAPLPSPSETPHKQNHPLVNALRLFRLT